MRKSRFSEERIIGILRRVEKGQPLADVCREEGISDATYYRWKAQYGGLEVNQLRRLRQLEDENRKLKQVVADLTLDNQASRISPQKTGDAHGTSTRRGLPANDLLLLSAPRLPSGGAHRSTMRYRFRVCPDEPQIRERLRDLGRERPRWGYRRLHVLLQRELGVINHKRIYRLYRLEGLKRPPAQTQAGGSDAAGNRVDRSRTTGGVGHGFHARRPGRWAPVSHAECLGSGDPRMPGHRGRYVVAWTTGAASTGSARELVWDAQADHA